MARKRLIPFKLLPASWGLTGKSYLKAKAEYELDGKDLKIALANIEHTGTDLEKALLQIEFEDGKLEEKDYQKKLATLNKEPWVDILGIDFDPRMPNAGGAFNLDWNDYFIDELRKNGFQGVTADQVVQRWFDTLCAQVALEAGIVSENEKTESIIRSITHSNGRKEYL